MKSDKAAVNKGNRAVGTGRNIAHSNVSATSVDWQACLATAAFWADTLNLGVFDLTQVRGMENHAAIETGFPYAARANNHAVREFFGPCALFTVYE